MKNIVTFFFSAIIFLYFTGCSRTIQSKEVINKIHTGSDLLNELGQPSEKNLHPDFEEWVYFRDTIETSGEKNKSDTLSKTVDTLANVNTGNVGQTVKNQPIKKHYRYISFLVDTNNVVVGHKNNGVDLTKKVPMGFGESLLEVLGGIAAITVIIIVEVINNKLDM